MDDKACSKIAWLYTCQLSRLRRESHACRLKNFDLLPAHGSRPISYTWLKNVSCCCLAWHNFQTYVNSDPCKVRQPCVKWINEDTSLVISDFWSEKHWERAHVYTSDVFWNFWTSSEEFGLLRVSSEMIVLSSKIPAISCLYLRKSCQVYNHSYIRLLEPSILFSMHPPPPPSHNEPSQNFPLNLKKKSSKHCIPLTPAKNVYICWKSHFFPHTGLKVHF